jgi:hypothetical protein
MIEMTTRLKLRLSFGVYSSKTAFSKVQYARGKSVSETRAVGQSTRIVAGGQPYLQTPDHARHVGSMPARECSIAPTPHSARAGRGSSMFVPEGADPR